jgi:hypothetical protein
VYTLGTGTSTSALIYASPDAVEISREESSGGRQEIVWLPRERVILNTLYEHQNGWRPSGTFDDPAVCVEYDCNMPTGIFTIELASATRFDVAVLFKRPRWPRRLTGRAIITTCPAAAEDAGLDAGNQLRWRTVVAELQAPQVGQRYFLVAFRRCGVADCEEWLLRTSTIRRWHRSVAGWGRSIR